jgi:hypothetical protein
MRLMIVNIETWYAAAFDWASDLIAYGAGSARSYLEAGLAVINESFPLIAEHLPQPLESCTLVLALAVWCLFRKARRDRAAMRGMLAELENCTMRIVNSETHQVEIERRLTRMRTDVTELGRRQRSFETRVGKPDPALAAAMARAGMQPQHMVDCGLSHTEVHLLNALNAGRGGRSQEAQM